jgi:hypothetical protein
MENGGTYLRGEVEIALAAHGRGSQEVLDDEHRNGSLRGDDQRALHAWLGADVVVPAVRAKVKPSFSKTLMSVW